MPHPRVIGFGVLGLAVAFGGIVVVLVITLVATRTLRLYRIPSSAMEPTLKCGDESFGCSGSTNDRILVLRYLFGSPGRGDIVVFHTPPQALTQCGSGGVFAKRIIALPGETWKEADGQVYVDGKAIREPYISPSRRDTISQGPIRVPAGDYFVMGDNRSGSCDSRRFGAIPRESVIGRVVATYWPPSRLTIR